MKRIFVLFLLFLVTNAQAQNEFAATAFFNEFNKVYSDGQTGFKNCKGGQVKTGFEALQTVFRNKCLLPLADSGKIIFPNANNPYAIYYFEPSKMRLKTDQLGVNLRDAIVIAFGQPLYARTETSMINENPFTNTLFFTDANQELAKDAIFRQCIYYQNGKYYMSFEVRGKNE